MGPHFLHITVQRHLHGVAAPSFVMWKCWIIIAVLHTVQVLGLFCSSLEPRQAVEAMSITV